MRKNKNDMMNDP